MAQTLHDIPDGRRGTLVTLKLMRALVRAAKTTPVIRNLALSLTGNLQQKDYVGEVRRIHAYVRDNTRYLRDVRGVETVQTPAKTLELGQGDCDDKATLLASLLESIGHPTRFVAMGFKDGDFCHVYVETRMGLKWIGLETTEPVSVGWYPPNQTSRMVIHN